MITLAEKIYNELEGSVILKYINICNYLNKYPKSKLAKDLYDVWVSKNRKERY